MKLKRMHVHQPDKQDTYYHLNGCNVLVDVETSTVYMLDYPTKDKESDIYLKLMDIDISCLGDKWKIYFAGNNNWDGYAGGGYQVR